MDRLSSAELLVQWVALGHSIAAMAERGVLCFDIGPENIGIDPDSHQLAIFDMDSFDPYPFPGELSVYATALFSLVGHIPMHFVSAFRFGFLHRAGRFGRLVFDCLRHDFEVMPWEDASQAPALQRLDERGWVEEHRHWMRRRDELDLPDLDDAALFSGLLRPHRALEAGQRWRRRDPELAFHAFERQLIVDLARDDPRHFLETIAEIGLLAAETNDRVRAQTWGLTLILLQKGLADGTPAFPDLVFRLEWTANEQARGAR